MLYDFIFEKFDFDKSGTVDLDECRTQINNILFAVVNEFLGHSWSHVNFLN